MVAAVDDVTEAMKDVVDPELGINVVDLGLIYDVMGPDKITDDGREQLRALGFTV
jgi:metal-sulfur cluster biosynthetic enzyme